MSRVNICTCTSLCTTPVHHLSPLTSFRRTDFTHSAALLVIALHLVVAAVLGIIILIVAATRVFPGKHNKTTIDQLVPSHPPFTHHQHPISQYICVNQQKSHRVTTYRHHMPHSGRHSPQRLLHQRLLLVGHIHQSYPASSVHFRTRPLEHSRYSQSAVPVEEYSAVASSQDRLHRTGVAAVGYCNHWG